MPITDQPPAIVHIDKNGVGYDANGQGYTKVTAGPGAIQNGPYSVIIIYNPKTTKTVKIYPK